MTLKVESAKERGVRRKPINKLLAARFTTNLGINTVHSDDRSPIGMDGWISGWGEAWSTYGAKKPRISWITCCHWYYVRIGMVCARQTEENFDYVRVD